MTHSFYITIQQKYYVDCKLCSIHNTISILLFDPDNPQFSILYTDPWKWKAVSGVCGLDSLDAGHYATFVSVYQLLCLSPSSAIK